MASSDERDEVPVPGTDEHRPAKSPRRTQSACWRDWANLTAGPAMLIAERALGNHIADYIRFRATCKAWRALSSDPRSHEISDQRFHPRHWIMLPCDFNVNRRRRFVNLSTGKCIHVGIPDLRRYYFVGATMEGFLVLCHSATHIVQLLNPITGQLTDLPTLDRARRLKVRSAGLTSDNTVALFYNSHELAVAKPGDKTWTWLSMENQGILTAFPFAGRMYCVTEKKILVVETSENMRPAQLVAVADYNLHGRFPPSCRDSLYPVLDERGVVLVLCSSDNYFMAYRANLDTGDMERITGLGGQALFVGATYNGLSQSVSTTFSPSIRPDTVYRCNWKNDPEGVAFGPSDKCFNIKFDKGDASRYLLAYVCS